MAANVSRMRLCLRVSPPLTGQSITCVSDTGTSDPNGIEQMHRDPRSILDMSKTDMPMNKRKANTNSALENVNKGAEGRAFKKADAPGLALERTRASLRRRSA